MFVHYFHLFQSSYLKDRYNYNKNMESCKHEEVNTCKENHLEYRKLISGAKKKKKANKNKTKTKGLRLTIVIFKEIYFSVFLLSS